MKKVFLIFLILSVIITAQQKTNDIPRDTSYTLFSTAKKMHEKFPDAKLVLPNLPSNVKEINDIVYTKIGERELHLNIFYPDTNNNKLFPGIILIHGGGWRSGDRSMVIPMAQRLASKGYVTAAVEYRLSIETLYPAAIHDIKSSIRWLRSNADKYKIDTNKIIVYGCSSGGHLAALIGTTNGEIKFEGNYGNLNHSSSVQAVINVDGVVDFFGKGTEELYKPSGKPSAAHLWFGVSPKEKPQLWKEGSAITHLDRNDPPFLFINSGVPRFHAGQEAMIELLKSYSIYYETYSLDDTIHTFWLFEPWFDKTLNYVLNFLDKRIK